MCLSRLAQDVIAGKNVGISDTLISLQITSHGVPDLTLIDLPGITRVAVEGQPKDIGDQGSVHPICLVLASVSLMLVMHQAVANWVV